LSRIACLEGRAAMFQVLNCLATEHDLRLVGLAGTVCLLASFAAVSLFHRALATRGGVRARWLAGAGIATGCGIWATHFIAMLAYQPSVPVGYDIQLTFLSFLAAVAITTAGLAIASLALPRCAAAGGAIVGAGVATMHYIGMAAVEVPGRITWSADLVIASVILGAVLGVAALRIATRDRAVRTSLLAALVLTLAIVSHHFTAMGAVVLVPDPARPINAFAMSEPLLALTIAGVTLAILSASILAAVMDRRLSEKNALLDAALNNMTHGLMMFDAAGGLILFNQRYVDLYRLPTGALKLGMTLREVIDLRIASSAFDLDPDEYCRDVLASIGRAIPSRSVVEMEDGRTIAVVGEPLASGGWVATHQDITEERRAERELRGTREFFNTVLESVPSAIAVKDASDKKFVFINRAAEDHFGMVRDEVIGRTTHELFPPTAAAIIVKRDDDLVASGTEQFYDTHPIPTPHKGTRFVTSRRVLIRDEKAEPRYVLNVIEDVTSRKQQEDELHRTRTFLDSIVENVPAMLTVKNAQSLRYALVNRAAERLFGVAREEMIGKTAIEVFPRDSTAAFDTMDREVIETGVLRAVEEHVFERPDGSKRLLTTKKLLVRGEDNTAQYVLTLSEDMTDRKLARDKIAHMARHDTLTDLPNRASFNDQLAAVLESASSEKMFAVLSLNLDRFKEANDVFGHAAGDALLCETARRLGEAADGAFLARLGGDEFALIVAEGAQPATAEALAARLMATMAADMTVGEHSLQIGLSIGIAVYPSDGKDATALLANANAALYRAKEAGRGTIRFFEAHMDAHLRDRRALQHDLRGAIENKELALHYQPQARIGGEIIGFEALVRWHHPSRGVISPGTFIPLAEESGLIMQLGEWVLREACREAASWPKPLQVAVNLSPVQFRDGDLPATVHEILLETGLAPDRLELEVTEGVLISDFARGVSILRRLKLLGVRIAMDDFGTGYSSLSYLQSFPFDKIKIDRTFIANLTDNHYSATIVRAVIGLGRGLGLPVMAEGVETAEQLAFLARESCDEVQGYLIGRPALIAAYADMIGRKSAPKLKVVSG
jgi:diguanylate cyclase (GGDEF)-like protein/PAS domain S-box-containing protein